MKGSGSERHSFRSIQCLRAVAALSLVVFHTLESAHQADSLFRIGTDIFFATSGFLAWSTTAGRDVAPTAFVVRRLVRIAPLYWLMTMAAFIAATERPGLYWMVDTTPAHLIQSLLFIPAYDRNGMLYPVILQAWMLNSLVFLYLLFGAALLLRPVLRLPAFSGSVLIIVLAGEFLLPRTAAVEAYTDPRLLEFVAGMWLARSLPRAQFKTGAWAGPAVLLGLVLLAGCQLLLDMLPWRLLTHGLPAVLLLAGCIMAEQASRFPRLSLLKLLGDASYSIYLIHVLVLEPIARLLPDVAIPARVLLTLVAVSISALGLYIFVEKPVDTRLRAITAGFLNRHHVRKFAH
jgi:exopolysaccharide production protein ExoZ